MLAIAGTACQRSPSSANQRSSGWASATSQTAALRQVVEAHLTGRRLDRQRQHVEGLIRLAVPAELVHSLGEIDVPRVADDRAVRVPVPGVPDELFVPQPGGGWLAGPVRREDGDHRADDRAFPLTGEREVVDQFLEDLVRLLHHAQIPDDEASPVQAADASAGVAPGDPGAEHQLGMGVLVGAGLLDFGPYLLQAGLEVDVLLGLGVVQPNELLGLGDVDRSGRVPVRLWNISVARHVQLVNLPTSTFPRSYATRRAFIVGGRASRRVAQKVRSSRRRQSR